MPNLQGWWNQERYCGPGRGLGFQVMTQKYIENFGGGINLLEDGGRRGYREDWGSRFLSTELHNSTCLKTVFLTLCDSQISQFIIVYTSFEENAFPLLRILVPISYNIMLPNPCELKNFIESRNANETGLYGKIKISCRIQGSHSGACEEFCLLGYSAV
jgi:hypothetical protein